MTLVLYEGPRNCASRELLCITKPGRKPHSMAVAQADGLLGLH